MSDSALFTSGSLFTTDYLVEAIRTDHTYNAVDVVELRAKIEAIANAFPQSHKTNESQTEDDLIWPVLSSLGWSESLRQQNLTVSGRDDVPDGVLFVDAEAKAAANAQSDQWKRYAHGLAVVESKRWARPLDRASGRDEATAPSTQMLRYLRRIDDLTSGQLRWGILTNGCKWRLYWAGARSVSEEFLEIDLSRVLALDGGDDLFADEATREHWLRVFAVMFCREAFIKNGPDNRSFHERARAAAAFYEERVAASLSKLVFEQVFPDLAGAIAQAAPHASLEDVRQASLVLLYRLLFLLYAEDRDLLPVGEKRYDDYALRHQRIEVGKRITEGDVFSASAGKIWAHVADLARIIDKGDASVGIPPYNGGLFAGDGTPLLDSIRIPDSVMAPTLDALSYERSSGERRYINYRDLSVQQLGSIYERLLEFEIVRDDAGALAVRPNLFARKNSGSYYTPDELVGLILDQTLEPLITERLDAFRTALDKLNPKDSRDYQIGDLNAADPAEEILKLRVCDPAMGSGHFLVSLVDTLADHVLDAMAEAQALAAEAAPDLEYISPLARKIEDIRATILRNAKAAGWTIDQAQLDDRHIVRRMVLKRCVYGVDKNPMAVELAKVALWLHTFTVGAPLSFIDHHLRAGDSLFGLWVRDAIDKAGAQGGELLHIGPLREAEASAAAMGIIERLTDAEIAEAHQSAATWYGVQSQIGPLDSFVSFLHALDWLNLKQAEDKAAVRALLDGQFGNPVEIMLGRQEPVARKSAAAKAGATDRMKKQRFDANELLEAAERILASARALIGEERFLNWQIAFPGVWEKWSSAERVGGFDAVIGNPPWDRIKLQQVEWFAARKPEIAMAQRASDRAKLIAKLKTDGDPLWDDFTHAESRAADTARMARFSSGKPTKDPETGKSVPAPSDNYPLLSGGDTNLNSLFVERAHALVKPGGMVGLLIPSGIASDQSSAAFFRKVVGEKQVSSIIDFFNKRYDGTLFFPDVYYRFKFCAYVAGGPGRSFDGASFGFFIRDLAEIDNPDRVFPITADEISRINPNSGTAPIFRSRRDKEITSGIYARLPVLVAKGSGDAVWSVRYATMFHMANDSDKFRTQPELEGDEAAWPIGGNRFQSAAGEWVPLYEGKMVQAFDHRASDIVLAAANVFRSGQGSDLTDEEHRDPGRLPTPRYWVKSNDTGWDAPTDWCVAMKDVTSVTNARTTITAIIPRYGAGHTLPVLFPGKGDDRVSYIRSAPLLLANLNCVVLDYLARQKVHGNHLAWYLVEQLPFILPADYDRAFGPKTAAEIVREAVLELTYTAHDLAPFARDMGHVDANGEALPPFEWDEARRLNLRAKLDALYFILYGVFDPANAAQSRDNIRYIYSTFPIVAQQEREKWGGSYKSEELCLAWINALMAGQPDAGIGS
ncbi:MAG: BREX-1 system adenine-specific DNA-methyltransferase PglX [Blastomonas sp.]|uniref:Eco57I restriction-modification methylase domain-containing protein n=1 Tax=Blastomonas sp. TaxID=1909299 RepID=UPI00406A1B56|nr:BREX-1 system adenine-specific DNA-methyltransferase PglX [Blastomonas sp.]